MSTKASRWSCRENPGEREPAIRECRRRDIRHDDRSSARWEGAVTFKDVACADDVECEPWRSYAAHLQLERAVEKEFAVMSGNKPAASRSLTLRPWLAGGLGHQLATGRVDAEESRRLRLPDHGHWRFPDDSHGLPSRARVP